MFLQTMLRRQSRWNGQDMSGPRPRRKQGISGLSEANKKVRLLAKAHLSDDETVAKMGHLICDGLDLGHPSTPIEMWATRDPRYGLGLCVRHPSGETSPAFRDEADETGGQKQEAGWLRGYEADVGNLVEFRAGPPLQRSPNGRFH